MGKKKAERFEFDVELYEKAVAERGLNYAIMGDRVGRCHTWLAPKHEGNKSGFTKAQLAVLRDSFGISYEDIKPVNKTSGTDDFAHPDYTIEAGILRALLSDEFHDKLEKTLIRANITSTASAVMMLQNEEA